MVTTIRSVISPSRFTTTAPTNGLGVSLTTVFSTNTSFGTTPTPTSSIFTKRPSATSSTRICVCTEPLLGRTIPITTSRTMKTASSTRSRSSPTPNDPGVSNWTTRERSLPTKVPGEPSSLIVILAITPPFLRLTTPSTTDGADGSLEWIMSSSRTSWERSSFSGVIKCRMTTTATIPAHAMRWKTILSSSQSSTTSSDIATDESTDCFLISSTSLLPPCKVYRNSFII